MLTSLLADVHFALRSLWHRKGFSGVAIVTAGLAIGITTAVYSTLDWMLYRSPTGVVDPERLVALRVTDGQMDSGIAFPQYQAIRDAQDVFADLAVLFKIPGIIGTDHHSDQVVFEFVTGNYFPMLGLHPLLGRTIAPEDDVAGSVPHVMISHAMWRSRFGSDPAAVGSTVTLNGQPALVIGIVPATFEGFLVDWNGPTSVWLPMQAFTPLQQSNMLTRSGASGNFPVIGRLRPGVSLEVARDRAQTWLPLLTAAPADRFRPTAIVVSPGSQLRIGVRQPAATFFGLLLAVCAVVLLAACFNIANFFIGRAAARRGELALRAALGATRARLVRHLAAEAALVGLAAGAVGLLVAVAVIRATAGLPRVFLRVPVTTEAVIDMQMIVVAIGLGLATAFVAGVFPAVIAAVRNPVKELKQPQPAWSWSGIRVSARQVLLVLQVALAVILTVAAGLHARSLLQIAALDSGYTEPERVLLARVRIGGMTPEASWRFFGDFMPRLEAMPGVVAASAGWNPPYAIGRTFVSLPGDDRPEIEVGATAASPRFFETLGIPMVSGREFDDRIMADVNEGLIINRVLAERLWPGESAVVGRRVMYGTEERTVTGVVAETRCRSMLGPAEPCAYRPFPRSTGYLRVRVEGDPLASVEPLRALVHEINPLVAVAEETTLDAHLRDLTAAERISATAAVSLAMLGIVLLAAGCASLFVWMVRESVREIAVRMTLGATGANVARRILARAAVLTGAGLLAGAYGAGVAAAYTADRLYEVSVWDPAAWLAAIALILGVALASAWSAAVLAARVDPAGLLRSE